MRNLTVLTAVLLKPNAIREKAPVAQTLMHSIPPPADRGDQRVRLRIILSAHWAAGFLLALSIWHVVDWNLTH